jgi:phenylalanyl-tRNA synthetase beta chain
VHDSEQAVNFFDLKGDLETLLEVFEVRDLQFQPDGERRYYEPDLRGRFVAGGQTLAVFGQLSCVVAREYKLRQTVWLGEVDLEHLLDFPLKARAFASFSKFPAVERDLSLLVPAGLPYSRLVEAVGDLGWGDIQGFRPVDVLPVGRIAVGHYSLLLRITLQNPGRTLTSEEIGEACRRVLAALGPLGVRLRT